MASKKELAVSRQPNIKSVLHTFIPQPVRRLHMPVPSAA